MFFKLDTDIDSDDDVVSLVVNGIYLTVHLHPDRRVAFVQTFDETTGITLGQASPQQCSEIIELLTRQIFPAIVSLQDQLRVIVSHPDTPLRLSTLGHRVAGRHGSPGDGRGADEYSQTARALRRPGNRDDAVKHARLNPGNPLETSKDASE